MSANECSFMFALLKPQGSFCRLGKYGKHSEHDAETTTKSPQNHHKISNSQSRTLLCPTLIFEPVLVTKNQNMMNGLCQIALMPMPTQGVQMEPETCRPGAIVHPTNMDIILGRGVLHASHPGNKRFYEIIDKYLPLYDAATSRADKTKVVHTIYETITSVGRFVKDDAASAACVVIETKKAKKKISHAIRFRRQAGKSFAAEARKVETVASSSKTSPSFQPVKKLQQPKMEFKQDSLNYLMQEKFVTTRRVSVTSLDCIIPDEDLESVLLLPSDEMELVSQTYGHLLWTDLNEDNLSDLKGATATLPLETKSRDVEESPQASLAQTRSYRMPDFRPLPLPPRFVSKPPPQPISGAVGTIPPPPDFPEDPLDLSICIGNDDINNLLSLCLGEDDLPLPPRFPHPSFE